MLARKQAHRLQRVCFETGYKPYPLKLFFICGTFQELIAVAYNRFIRMDPSTGEALKTWRFNTMKVNIRFLVM